MTTDDLVDPAPQLLRRGAVATGIGFLLVGAAGFVPGLTTDLSELRFASHHSRALLFGLFQTSVLHNLLHLGFGVAGLGVARSPRLARGYLILGGLAYLGLFAYGLAVGQDSAANVIPMDSADDVLHLFLGVLMITLGVGLSHPGLRRAEAGTPTR